MIFHPFILLPAVRHTMLDCALFSLEHSHLYNVQPLCMLITLILNPMSVITLCLFYMLLQESRPKQSRPPQHGHIWQHASPHTSVSPLKPPGAVSCPMHCKGIAMAVFVNFYRSIRNNFITAIEKMAFNNLPRLAYLYVASTIHADATVI